MDREGVELGAELGVERWVDLVDLEPERRGVD